MTIYLFLMGFTLFAGFAGELVARKLKKLGKFIKVFFPILAFYLIASIKDVSVGIDTIEYYTLYISMGDYTWFNLTGQQFEVGYMVLNKFCYELGLTWQQFLFVGYFLIFGSLGTLILWRSKTPTTTMMMAIALFLGMWLSAYRQSIAAALFALAVSCFCAKNWGVKILGIALAIGAATIHSSVYAGFALFILYFLKFRKSFIWVLVPFLLLLYLVSPYVYETIYFLFTSNSKYLANLYDGGGLFFTFLIMAILMYLLMEPNKFTNYVDKKLGKIDGKIGRFVPVGDCESWQDKYFNVSLWAMALLVAIQAFGRTNLVIVRLKDVMELTAIVGFPSIFFSFKSKGLRAVIYLGMNIALFLLTYYSVLVPDNLNIVPYEVYFSVSNTSTPAIIKNPTALSPIIFGYGQLTL